MFDSLPGVGIVERLVPDEPWELFLRVVPEAPTRPKWERLARRYGDRKVLLPSCSWPCRAALRGVPQSLEDQSTASDALRSLRSVHKLTDAPTEP